MNELIGIILFSLELIVLMTGNLLKLKHSWTFLCVAGEIVVTSEPEAPGAVTAALATLRL